MLQLFKSAQRGEVLRPADCDALHQQLQDELQAMDQCVLQAYLKELREHHYNSYPTKEEQTYQYLVKCAADFAVQGQGVRVSLHGAAGGELGGLVRAALPTTSKIIESDIVPGQAPGVTGVSPQGYPLLADGTVAVAGSFDIALARNCFYSHA